MKKLLIITISIMIILALASSVMAKAVQLELTPTPTGVLAGEEGTGNAILNNPEGEVNFIVQINIKNAKPNAPYQVWINADQDLSPLDSAGVSTVWNYLGELTTNEVGNGHFHSNVQLDYSGLLTNVQVALNPGEEPAAVMANYKSEFVEIEIK